MLILKPYKPETKSPLKTNLRRGIMGLSGHRLIEIGTVGIIPTSPDRGIIPPIPDSGASSLLVFLTSGSAFYCGGRRFMRAASTRRGPETISSQPDFEITKRAFSESSAATAKSIAPDQPDSLGCLFRCGAAWKSQTRRDNVQLCPLSVAVAPSVAVAGKVSNNRLWGRWSSDQPPQPKQTANPIRSIHDEQAEHKDGYAVDLCRKRKEANKSYCTNRTTPRTVRQSMRFMLFTAKGQPSIHRYRGIVKKGR